MPPKRASAGSLAPRGSWKALGLDFGLILASILASGLRDRLKTSLKTSNFKTMLEAKKDYIGALNFTSRESNFTLLSTLGKSIKLSPGVQN